MKTKLVSQDAASRQTVFVITKYPAVIGRMEEAVVRLQDSWVSRRHCEVDEVDGALVVRDLGSRHGTYVNGVRIAEVAVEPGDRLTVGISTFQVCYGRPATGALSSIFRRAVGGV